MYNPKTFMWSVKGCPESFFASLWVWPKGTKGTKFHADFSLSNGSRNVLAGKNALITASSIEEARIIALARAQDFLKGLLKEMESYAEEVNRDYNL